MVIEDSERDRITAKAREDARVENRIYNLEEDMKAIQSDRGLVMKAMWGGIAYLALQAWEFVSSGGILP